MTSSIDYYTEVETITSLIDMDIREAGWIVCDIKEAVKPETACIETNLQIFRFQMFLLLELVMQTMFFMIEIVNHLLLLKQNVHVKM